MALTRVRVEENNGRLVIVDKQTGIYDDNPTVWHGNEELPITDEDISSGRVKYIGRGLKALGKIMVCYSQLFIYSNGSVA